MLLCSLCRSPFVYQSLSTEQLNAKYNRSIIQYTITYNTQCSTYVHAGYPPSCQLCMLCVRSRSARMQLFRIYSVPEQFRNVLNLEYHSLPASTISDNLFSRSEKLLCVDYCCFHNESYIFFIMLLLGRSRFYHAALASIMSLSLLLDPLSSIRSRGGWAHNHLTGHSSYRRQFSDVFKVFKIYTRLGGGRDFCDSSFPKKNYLLENTAISYNIRI